LSLTAGEGGGLGLTSLAGGTATLSSVTIAVGEGSAFTTTGATGGAVVPFTLSSTSALTFTEGASSTAKLNLTGVTVTAGTFAVGTGSVLNLTGTLGLAANASSFVFTGRGDLDDAGGTNTFALVGSTATFNTSGMTVDADALTITTATTGVSTITTGLGADTITGGAGNDVINAGVGANSVTGGAGDDTLTTSTGSDTVLGGDGNDTISSGAAADTVTGGAGNDVINGGDGADTYVYGATITDSSITSTTLAAAGFDVVTVTNGDIFDFNATIAVVTAATIASGVAIDTSTGTLLIGQLNTAFIANDDNVASIEAMVISFTGAQRFLVIDTDSSQTITAADNIIQLSGVVTALTLTDGNVVVTV